MPFYVAVTVNADITPTFIRGRAEQMFHFSTVDLGVVRLTAFSVAFAVYNAVRVGDVLNTAVGVGDVI